ncbi:hypothetical protein QBC32DRAFT_221527 [Pseudoneurospora amorphoporcata]|uniref:Uncharacterized protein n=1 Tax=Pseudoneurospora amorphoporcata TaxID=241081 RepID=A0AAN6NP89_9PEZI|nr:hypothetical protein QBC32DRAFT_221527 [Pseudoneurospora amorphoporcata]
MNLLSSTLRQRPAWAEVATRLLHNQPGGRWHETDLEQNDITLMIPSGNSYQVLRLLLLSAVDVGNKQKTIEWIGGLHDLCRSDISNASEAKIVYALESGTRDATEGDKVEEEKEKGLEGFMKLQIDLLSTQNPSLSCIPILPISHPSDLPSLLSSLQQRPPSPAPASAPAPAPIPIPAGTHSHYQPNSYNHPRGNNFNTYIPSRDTLLPLCTVPSASHAFFTPLTPYSVSVLSGPIFINFPGLRDLLELVETEEGKHQIRNAMTRASGDGQLAEIGRVEAERFLAFWEHEFAV